MVRRVADSSSYSSQIDRFCGRTTSRTQRSVNAISLFNYHCPAAFGAATNMEQSLLSRTEVPSAGWRGDRLNNDYGIPFALSSFHDPNRKALSRYRDPRNCYMLLAGIGMFSKAPATYAEPLIPGVSGSPYLAGFAPHSDTSIINVTDSPYRAVGNGITDDTAAFAAAVSAMKGSLWRTIFPFSGCRSLYVPKGLYLIRQAEVLHLTQEHSGCQIFGDGPYSSVINFAPQSGGGPYLISHDEEDGDGPLQSFEIRDIGFIGPGAKSQAGWFWDRGGPAGTSGLLVQNVSVSQFEYGFRVEGTAMSDLGSFVRFHARHLRHTFYSSNLHAMGYTVISADINTANDNDDGVNDGDVFYFADGAATDWTIVGGYLGAFGSGAVFHYAPDFSGGFNNQNLNVHGTHIELYNNSALVRDDSPGKHHQMNFHDVNMYSLTGQLQRVVATVKPKTRFIWQGGALTGLIQIQPADTSFGMLRPMVIIEDADLYEALTAQQSFIPPGPCPDPATCSVHLKRVLLMDTGELLNDQ